MDNRAAVGTRRFVKQLTERDVGNRKRGSAAAAECSSIVAISYSNGLEVNEGYVIL